MCSMPHAVSCWPELMSRLSYSCSKQTSYPISMNVTDIIRHQKSLWIASSTAVLKMLTLLWHDAQIATVMQIAHIAYAGMTKSSINTEIQTNFAGDNHTSCDSAAYGFSCTCVLNWVMTDDLVVPMWALWDVHLYMVILVLTHNSHCLSTNSADATGFTAATSI